MYFVRTFGEIVDQAWVPGKATYAFEGGQQFENLPVLRRRGRQKDKGYKYMVTAAIPFLFFIKIWSVLKTPLLPLSPPLVVQM